MVRTKFSVKLLLCLIGIISSLVVVVQYSRLHQQSALRSSTLRDTQPKFSNGIYGHVLIETEEVGDDDDELASSELHGFESNRGQIPGQIGLEHKGDNASGQKLLGGKPITLAKRPWENEAPVTSSNSSPKTPLRIVDAPWENDPDLVEETPGDAPANIVDALWDDAVHDNVKAAQLQPRDVFMPRLTPNGTSDEVSVQRLGPNSTSDEESVQRQAPNGTLDKDIIIPNNNNNNNTNHTKISHGTAEPVGEGRKTSPVSKVEIATPTNGRSSQTQNASELCLLPYAGTGRPSRFEVFQYKLEVLYLFNT